MNRLSVQYNEFIIPGQSNIMIIRNNLFFIALADFQKGYPLGNTAGNYFFNEVTLPGMKSVIDCRPERMT